MASVVSIRLPRSQTLAVLYRRIIESRSWNPFSLATRLALRAIALPYGVVVRRRNRRYDQQQATIHRVSVPVISVGNLTLGGTGKTPMVRWVADWLIQQGLAPSLVSRGYRAERSTGQNDEALELQARLVQVPHVQHPDRVLAAQQAIANHQVDVIVLDDGFQHRRLHRDLDIVLIDATEPTGLGHLFPRGTLREPLTSLRRADAVVLTRADMISDAERLQICNQIAPYLDRGVWAEVAHQPHRLLNCAGQEKPTAELAQVRVAAFSGIGNPRGFRHTLTQCGAEVLGFREFPDHHHFQPADLQQLHDWVSQLDRVDFVVCTHKDLVKLREANIGGCPLWAVTIGQRFLSGETAFTGKIRQVAGLPC